MKKPERMAYQPASILLCGEFRRGHDYHERRELGTDDWLLIYTLAGSGRITGRGHSAQTEAGEAILYAPGEFQQYGTDSDTGRWNLLWAHFKPRLHWQPLLLWPRGPHGAGHLRLHHAEVRRRFVQAMRRMLLLDRRTLPNAADLAANALEEALLWAHVTVADEPWLKLDERVRKTMDYLGTHLREPFRMDVLARHCGVSVSRLAHLFTDQVGISPQRFIERQRMQHAAQLLRLTGMPIAGVAAESGFDDPFYFSHRFRRHHGQSPTAFRSKK